MTTQYAYKMSFENEKPFYLDCPWSPHGRGLARALRRLGRWKRGERMPRRSLANLYRRVFAEYVRDGIGNVVIEENKHLPALFAQPSD